MKTAVSVILCLWTYVCFAQSTTIKTGGGNEYLFGQNTIEINSSNSLIGQKVASALVDGIQNTFLGAEAGVSNRNGSNNTFIGFQAGYANVDSRGSVMIGYQAGKNENRDDVLYIANSDTSEPLIFGDFRSQEVKVNSNLEVSNYFRVKGNGRLDGNLHMVGEITTDGGLSVNGDLILPDYSGPEVSNLGVDEDGKLVKISRSPNKLRFNRYEFAIEQVFTGFTLIQQGVQFEDGTVLTGFKALLMDNNTTGSSGVLNTAFAGLYRKSRFDHSAPFQVIYRVDGLDSPTNTFVEYTTTSPGIAGANIVDNSAYIYVLQVWYCDDCAFNEVVLVE